MSDPSITTLGFDFQQVLARVIHCCMQENGDAELSAVLEKSGLNTTPTWISGWLERAASTLTPLIDAMWDDTTHAPFICAYAAPLNRPGAPKKGWVFVTPARHVLVLSSSDEAAIHELFCDYTGYFVFNEHVVREHLRHEHKPHCPTWPLVRRLLLRGGTLQSHDQRELLSRVTKTLRIEGAAPSMRCRSDTPVSTARPTGLPARVP